MFSTHHISFLFALCVLQVHMSCVAALSPAHVATDVPESMRKRVEKLRPTSPPQDKCTTIAVGREATADGSTMATQTVDCFDCDWRVNKVPAMDHPAGATRPIYLLTSAYPRQVRSDRGETWSPENLDDGRRLPGEVLVSHALGDEGLDVSWSDDSVGSEGSGAEDEEAQPVPNPHAEWAAQEGKVILGTIPQVNHTYAVFEGMYGIMNEHQVCLSVEWHATLNMQCYCN
jgi:dipeptidase